MCHHVSLWLCECVRCISSHISLWRIWIQAPSIIYVYTQHVCDKTSIQGTCERIIFLSLSLSFFYLSFNLASSFWFPFSFFLLHTIFFITISHDSCFSFLHFCLFRDLLLFFSLSFWSSSFFLPFSYYSSSRSAIRNKKRVYVCVHILWGPDIVYSIQYLLLLHAYAISLFFSLSLFSFLRFLFLTVVFISNFISLSCIR